MRNMSTEVHRNCFDVATRQVVTSRLPVLEFDVDPTPRLIISAPLVADPAREYRREMVALSKLLVRRKTSFHGWLQTTALGKVELTNCGCGLINCR